MPPTLRQTPQRTPRNTRTQVVRDGVASSIAMYASKKSLNPLRRKSMRILGQSTEHDAEPVTAKQDTSGEKVVVVEDMDAAGDQLIQEMNRAAGKTPNKGGRPRKRRRKEADASIDSPSHPHTPDSSSRGVGSQPQPSARSSTVRLKKPAPRDKPAGNTLQRDVFQMPGDEGGPSLQPRKIIKLNQPKPANASPFRQRGEIDLSGARGVDLDDAPPTKQAKKGRRPRQPLTDDESDSEVEQRAEKESEPATQHMTNLATAPKSNDAVATFYERDGDGGADEAVNASNQEEADPGPSERQKLSGKELEKKEQQEREKEERLRQKCCRGVESHIQVFDCGGSWGTLLVAAHKYRLIIKEYVRDHAETRATTKYEPRTEVGKAATEALGNLLKLYEDESMDWTAEATAATAAYQATRQIKDNESASKRALDLYLSVLPLYASVVKAALQRVQPKPTSTRVHLEPLVRILKYTSDALERARTWQPRPRAFGGYNVLALVRDDYSPSIKNIREAYDKQIAVLKAAEDVQRARQKEEERVQHQEEIDRQWGQARLDRIQESRNSCGNLLEAMRMKARSEVETRRKLRAEMLAEQKQQQRRPLNEITRRVVGHVDDIDEFDEDGTRRIYQDPKPWSQAELTALWQALTKQYPKENRFAMIHRRHGREMPGRTVDEIRQQAVVQKRGCMDLVASLPPAEAAKWNFLMSVPG